MKSHKKPNKEAKGTRLYRKIILGVLGWQAGMVLVAGLIEYFRDMTVDS